MWYPKTPTKTSHHPRNNTHHHSPADDVSDDVGVADDDLKRVVFLLDVCSVDEALESLLYAGAIFQELLMEAVVRSCGGKVAV